HWSYCTMTVSFMAIAASTGFVVLSSAVFSASRSPWLVIAAMSLYVFGPARFMLRHKESWQPRWGDIEVIAREVNRVTSRDGLVYARGLYFPAQATYVASRRFPPPGMENHFGMLLSLPPDLAQSLHVASSAEVDRWLAQGRFATVVTWPEDPRLESLRLARLYNQRTEVAGYYIF